MRVHILGPNLRDQSKGGLHIHKEGCADVKRSANYQGADHKWQRENAEEIASLREATTSMYPPDDFGYDEEEEWEGYSGEFYVFPCASELPHDVEPQDTSGKYEIERAQAIAYVWGYGDGSSQPAGDSLAFGDHWVAYLTERAGGSRDAIDTVYAQWREANRDATADYLSGVRD